MALLYFASDYRIGLSALLTDQLVAIKHSGLNVIALAGECEQEPGLTERLAENNINIIRIEGLDAHLNFKALAQQISEIAKVERISVVHVQNNWQLSLITYARYVYGLSNVKVLYTLHGFRNNHKIKSMLAQILIGSALMLFATRVICMSKYLKRKFRLLAYKIELLPLGVSDNFFDMDTQISLSKGLQMIFAAQFRDGKNQELLISAFAKYVELSSDNMSQLTLPGEGANLERCRSLAVDLGIADRVVFPGSLSKEEVLKLYLDCNIGLVSSNSETFGQSIVEPFVLGRCVISTNVGIAPDIIENGKNGYIFNGLDDLTNIMIKLHDNLDILSAIYANNINSRDMFRWENVCLKYKNKILNY